MRPPPQGVREHHAAGTSGCQPELGAEEAAGLGQGRKMCRSLSETPEVFKVRAGGSSKSQYKCKTLLSRWIQSLFVRDRSLKLSAPQ